ncbi:hypothetical protein HaLaN_04346 [Haematococcus lacustris]|uniref:Uncharacterized protein n=1 Tax=Haematococcus lacustris TaxID=44745 RepID=A0A699Z1J4_HAELA|nr:hypothetical protein HaLaN_04346 [Haematococcus lacustris]
MAIMLWAEARGQGAGVMYEGGQRQAAQAVRRNMWEHIRRCTHPLADDDRHSTYEGPGVSGEEQYSGGGGRGGAGSREVYNDEDVDDEVVHHEFKREERGMKLKERQRKLGGATRPPER